MVFNLSEQNSILSKFIAELRNVETQMDRMRFRRNLERLGEVMAYEISKQFEYEEKEVETPLGIAKVSLPSNKLVLCPILRAGLPLHQGMLNFFDDASSAFVSTYRNHHRGGAFEVHMEYVSGPDIANSVLIICDPMLATGSSMSIAAEGLLELGQPQKIHFVTAIAARNGMNRLKRLFPKADIWMGALDEELTAKSYIVPGLGDAGDLCFGDKMQD